jgi:hypothetical protein
MKTGRLPEYWRGPSVHIVKSCAQPEIPHHDDNVAMVHDRAFIGADDEEPCDRILAGAIYGFVVVLVSSVFEASSSWSVMGVNGGDRRRWISALAIYPFSRIDGLQNQIVIA